MIHICPAHPQSQPPLGLCSCPGKPMGLLQCTDATQQAAASTECSTLPAATVSPPQKGHWPLATGWMVAHSAGLELALPQALEQRRPCAAECRNCQLPAMHSSHHRKHNVLTAIVTTLPLVAARRPDAVASLCAGHSLMTIQAAPGGHPTVARGNCAFNTLSCVNPDATTISVTTSQQSAPGCCCKPVQKHILSTCMPRPIAVWMYYPAEHPEAPVLQVLSSRALTARLGMYCPAQRHPDVRS